MTVTGMFFGLELELAVRTTRTPQNTMLQIQLSKFIVGGMILTVLTLPWSSGTL